MIGSSISQNNACSANSRTTTSAKAVVYVTALLLTITKPVQAQFSHCWMSWLIPIATLTSSEVVGWLFQDTTQTSRQNSSMLLWRLLVFGQLHRKPSMKSNNAKTMSIPRPEKATQRDNLAASLAAFRAKGNDVKVLPETPKGKTVRGW